MAIIKDAVKTPTGGGYWLYHRLGALGGYCLDGEIYIVDTKDNTASLPGIPESKANLSNFTGVWKRPEKV